MHSRFVLLGVVVGVMAACGGSDQPSQQQQGGTPTCTLTATATADTGAKTITGVGALQCDQAADLTVETCVQWNANGAFEDIQCKSSSASGQTQLELQNVASCGVDTTRRFRARVNATVNGTAQPEQLSTEVGCQ